MNRFALHDLTGKRFGRWLVLRRGQNDKHRPRWVCRCECGREVLVRSEHLKSGRSTQCETCRKNPRRPCARPGCKQTLSAKSPWIGRGYTTPRDTCSDACARVVLLLRKRAMDEARA